MARWTGRAYLVDMRCQNVPDAALIGIVDDDDAVRESIGSLVRRPDSGRRNFLPPSLTCPQIAATMRIVCSSIYGCRTAADSICKNT
jgi:hypothetical protein